MRVSYVSGMAVDRLSVTVPSELGAALRALAEERGATVSMVVSEAIAREVRGAELTRALAAATERFGPVPEALVKEAEAELTPPPKRKRRK